MKLPIYSERQHSHCQRYITASNDWRIRILEAVPFRRNYCHYQYINSNKLPSEVRELIPWKRIRDRMRNFEMPFFRKVENQWCERFIQCNCKLSMKRMLPAENDILSHAVRNDFNFIFEFTDGLQTEVRIRSTYFMKCDDVSTKCMWVVDKCR